MKFLDPIRTYLRNRLVRAGFDRDYYLARYPDVAQAQVDPAAHFCATGWREGRDPHPEFSTRYYLQRNPDVAASGVNPFWHFLAHGKSEGRRGSAIHSAIAMRAGNWKMAMQVADIEASFDRDFYLRSLPEARDGTIDPVWHYCETGWHEGRDPHPEFSTQYYLDANPDVAASGLNPFWHYVVAGKAEGRVARHPGGWRAAVLEKLRPLDETAPRRPAPDQPLSASDIGASLGVQPGAAGRRLILSFGHDDYRKISGGIQLCIQRELAEARTEGIGHLNIHPCRPLKTLAGPDDDPFVTLVLDGDDLGACLMSEIEALAQVLAQNDTRIDVIVHSLLGHAPERIARTAQFCGRGECWFWLHDYFTICPSYALQRNDIAYCHAPAATSAACGICRYGMLRVGHQDRIAAFFAALSVHVLAPSAVARDLWRAHGAPTCASLSVAGHMTMQWTLRDEMLAPAADGPIRIGFVGTPAAHKGWPVFERLIRSQRGRHDLQFVYLGNHPVTISIETVHVHVTAENYDAMIDAIRDAAIDLVLHWAEWPETFSFSTCEALIGGAHVITNRGSGNVAATVTRLNRGAVMADEAELQAFFGSAQVRELAQDARAARASHQVHHRLSRMTLPFLLQEDA